MSEQADPHPLTEEEVRTRLLKHIWGSIRYWENESSKPSAREKLEGLAFSILSSLDGSSPSLPKFIVAPDPHPEDKKFSASNGINWWIDDEAKRDKSHYWPINCDADISCDIAGALHESFYAMEQENGRVGEDLEES